MRHLIDAREPITTEDIDQASSDAHKFIDQARQLQELEEPLWLIVDLVARLVAVVDDTYGCDRQEEEE